jgi:hypothetical protein
MIEKDTNKDFFIISLPHLIWMSDRGLEKLRLPLQVTNINLKLSADNSATVHAVSKVIFQALNP